MLSALQGYYADYRVKQKKLSAEQEDAQIRATGSSQINFKIEKMNFDVLRRKRAFYTGIDIQLKPEFGETKELLGWAQMPDVLPVKPKDGFVSADYKTLLANTKTWEAPTPGGETPDGEETAGAPEQPEDWEFYQYDLALENQAYKEEFLAKFELINKRALDKTKPYFVIYDPSTVKNRDVLSLVRERVNDA